jgi:uncharacterized protein (TIGR02453 family)
MDYHALIAFLSELAANNNKPWFEENRSTYEHLRGGWIALVGQVIDGISQFDPAVGIVSPKDALFRINRDIRFSKDKSPYKTTFSAAICPQGRHSGMPVYYFQINAAGELLIAGGLYRPERDKLNRIRQYIAEHPELLDAVLADPDFAATFGEISGDRLTRPPQGYDEDTLGIEFIKLKSFTAGIQPARWIERGDALVNDIVAAFQDLFPLIRWSREALGGVDGATGEKPPVTLDGLLSRVADENVHREVSTGPAMGKEL